MYPGLGKGLGTYVGLGAKAPRPSVLVRARPWPVYPGCVVSPGDRNLAPMSSKVTRNTNLRDRHRAAIRVGSPPCWLCGGAIDYALPSTEPMGYVVDHVVPLAKGGPDTLANKKPAHRRCNRAKGARTDGGPVVKRSGSVVVPEGF